MKYLPIFAMAALVGGLSAAGPLLAEQVFNEDVIIDGSLCAGNGCSSGDGSVYGAVIKSAIPLIKFEDTDTSTAVEEWAIIGREESFTVRRGINDTIFAIEPSANVNSLFIDSSGIGLGTSLPQRELHVVDGASAGLRLEQDTSGGFGPHIWDLSSSDAGFLLSDVGSFFSSVPFRVENGAANSALILSSNGNIGMGPGALTPAATLHLTRNSGNTQLKIEETNGTQTARPLLNMVNHGRPDIIMTNTATGGEWAFGAGTNFVLKNGAVGSGDGDKNLQLKLYGATGNLEITGQIITGGGTCGGGCDAVFSEDYDLPTIREHGAAMFALGHLPNVGPTREGAPINVSDKLGRMLNELEHAHIYIAELEAQVSGLRTGQAALEARLQALEAD